MKYYESKYTGAEVDALLGKVESGEVGGKVTVDSVLSTTSENPVMNKVITAELSSLGESISSLAESKADKDGVYSEMTVGRSIDLLGVEDVQEGSFIFRPTDGDGSIKDGVAVVKSVKGDSVVWNQLYKPREAVIGTQTNNGVTFIVASDGSVTANGTSTLGTNASSYIELTGKISLLSSHIYMLVAFGAPAGRWSYMGLYFGGIVNINSLSIIGSEGYKIFSSPADGVSSLTLACWGGQTIDCSFRPQFYDLTKMFGVGNEPTTIEDFYARVATLCIEDMNAYNAGEVVNMKASGIKSVGFNAWDEEWEVGSMGDNNGDLISSSRTIRSKNYIRAIGGNEYYFGYFGNVVTWGRVHYYDAEKKWIGSIAKTLNGASFIPPLNCAYMKFRMADGYGTTYNNDICINLVHSGYRNGEYEPYVEDVLALPTLDLFPNGMNKIGDVYDEYDSEKSVQRFGSVDLGTLTWRQVTAPDGFKYFHTTKEISDAAYTNLGVNILNARHTPVQKGANEFADKDMRIFKTKWLYIRDDAYTDVESFKAAMSGVVLYYELEEPIVTPHKQRLAYKAWDFGTEQVIAEGNTIAITAGITYEFNARDTIRGNKTRLDVLEPIVAGKIDKVADDYYPQLAVGTADNLAGVDVVDSDFVFRRSGGGAISDGVARVESIKGNSVVWNQLIIGTLRSSGNTTITNNGDVWTITPDGENVYLGIRQDNFIIPKGHKYLVAYETLFEGTLSTGVNMCGQSAEINLTSGGSWISDQRIIEYTTGNNNAIIIFFRNAKSEIKVRNFIVIDLTKMFGAGNEPTTIEEFYARIPMGVDLNAYNEGEVIHMDVQSIESQGVNAWDEEWELGNINTQGALIYATDRIRSKNYIGVLANTLYNMTLPTPNASVFFFDTKYNFISYVIGKSFTTPSNCRYIKFVVGNSSYVTTTYNHDVCINISDTSINGKYFPYIKRVEDLSIIRKYFPDGMKKAGTAHDEVYYDKTTNKKFAVQRMGQVNTWELTWNYMGISESNPYGRFSTAVSGRQINQGNILCTIYTTQGASYTTDKNIFGAGSANTIIVIDSAYTDVASFTAMLQEKKVVLCYELAEPIVTELDAEDQFKDLDYQVWNCGTEKAIAEGKSAPLAADITYGFNAIGKIKELESLVAALRAKVGI